MTIAQMKGGETSNTTKDYRADTDRRNGPKQNWTSSSVGVGEPRGKHSAHSSDLISLQECVPILAGGNTGSGQFGRKRGK